MDDENEEWRVIKGWPNYDVSSLGRIRSNRPWVRGTRQSRLLKPWLLNEVYLAVTLYGDGGAKLKETLHVLVCEAFHGPRPTPAHEAAHWDGLPTNCRSDNLRWATCVENNADKARHGTKLLGSQLQWAVLTEGDVREIRKLAAEGEDDKSIAAKFGVKFITVQQIRINHSWSWLAERDGAEPVRRPRPKGTAHHKNRLTESEVLAIRASSAREKDLAEQFCVHKSTISGIRHRRIWRHLP